MSPCLPNLRIGTRDRLRWWLIARTGVPTRSVRPPQRSGGCALRIGHTQVYVCVCVYVYVYIFYVVGPCSGCPALIRVIGTTAHPGAVATVPHGCPALIRASGTTGRWSARSLARHAGSGRKGRGYARRTSALRGAAGRRGDQKSCRHRGATSKLRCTATGL
jgi:hypothetical protein